MPHAPRDAMARRIPPARGLLEAVDAERCLLQCGANDLDQRVYWLLAFNADFEVLEPAALKQRLVVAGDRVARSIGAAAAPARLARSRAIKSRA